MQLAAKDIAEHEARGVDAKYIEALESKWTVILRNWLPKTEIANVTYDATIEYIARRRRDGVRGQTIIREVQCLRRVTEIARRRKLRTAPPFAWPKVKRDQRDMSRSGKLRDGATILAFLDELDEEAARETLFAGLTGLRAAELKRACFEWVRDTKHGPELAMPDHATKGKRSRVIPLSPAAMNIVMMQRLRRGDDSTIFSAADHKKARMMASKRIKLETPITLRDLRHTFASNALLHAKDLAAVRDLLGHTDIRQTDTYTSSAMPNLHTAAHAAANGINVSGTPRHVTENMPTKQERETRFELATFSLGSAEKQEDTEKLRGLAPARDSVILYESHHVVDHQAGSPHKAKK